MGAGEKRKVIGRAGMPRTGDGKTHGRKPKAEEIVVQHRRDGRDSRVRTIGDTTRYDGQHRRFM